VGQIQRKLATGFSKELHQSRQSGVSKLEAGVTRNQGSASSNPVVTRGFKTSFKARRVRSDWIQKSELRESHRVNLRKIVSEKQIGISVCGKKQEKVPYQVSNRWSRLEVESFSSQGSKRAKKNFCPKSPRVCDTHPKVKKRNERNNK
jgi:hypothetical protein